MKKFTFNHDFEKPAPIDPNAPKYTEDEMRLIRDQAYAEGVTEGRSIQQQIIDADLARALIGFEDKLVQFVEAEALRRQAIQSEAAQLAKTVALKICLTDLEKHSVDRVVTCMDRVTQSLLGNPTMAIKVNPKLVQPLADRVKNLISQGQIQVRSDELLDEVDCAFSWASGGAEVILKNTLNEIDRLISEISQPEELPNE